MDLGGAVRNEHKHRARVEFSRYAGFSQIRSHILYVIVIAQGQGFMAVNGLSPRTMFVYCHKSLVTRAITIIVDWLVVLNLVRMLVDTMATQS